MLLTNRDPNNTSFSFSLRKQYSEGNDQFLQLNRWMNQIFYCAADKQDVAKC